MTEAGPAQTPAGHRALVLFSVFVIGACGLVYELIAGAAASYLLGDSVTQYSLVIGVFLAAMGLGAYLTQWIHQRLLSRFLRIQLAIGLLGGFSGLLTFAAFAATDAVSAVVLAITTGIGTLVGMEIPLVIRILRHEDALRVDVAQVLTFDYVGALVGSAAFPFLILPHLGLVRAALAAGMLNVLIATWGLALFAPQLPDARAIGRWVVIAWVALIAGFAFSGRATQLLEDQLYPDEIVLAETSSYQRIIVTRWRDDVRLYLDGHLQFSSADEYRYHEALVRPALAARRASGSPSHPLRVLILGGGDGLAAAEVLRHPPIASIDLVDIDPRVVELFRDREQLSALNGAVLSDARVKVHAMDAFKYLREADGAAYDVILMDLPDPGSVPTNKLYSSACYGLALRRLSPAGALVTQASSPFYAREAFWCIDATMTAAARRTRVVRRVVPYHVQVPSFGGDWGFVLAAASAPEDWRLPASARYLTPALFAQARVFPPDSARVETEINTLDRPVLTRYYRAGWKRWNE